MQNTSTPRFSKSASASAIVNRTLKEAEVKRDSERTKGSAFENSPNNPNPNYVFSLDSKISNKHGPLPFKPTLSLLLVPKPPSDASPNANFLGPEKCKGSPKPTNQQNQNPRLIYMGIKDQTIERHRKYLAILVLGLVITSLISFAFSLWIHMLVPETFTAYLLSNGTVPEFPLYCALLTNALFGLLNCVSLIIAYYRKSSKRMLLLINICVACCSWGAFTVIYNFGANILYNDQLEELMADDMQDKNQFPQESPLWTNSQNFFDCCGITSFESWNWRKRPGGIRVYPSPCCHSGGKNHANSTPCEASAPDVRKMLISKSGCLDRELDAVLGISYSTFVVSTIHLQLSVLATMIVIKIFCRQRLLEDVELELELSSSSLDTNDKTKDSLPTNDKPNATLQEVKTDNSKPNNVNSSQIKRSFTM